MSQHALELQKISDIINKKQKYSLCCNEISFPFPHVQFLIVNAQRFLLYALISLLKGKKCKFLKFEILSVHSKKETDKIYR